MEKAAICRELKYFLRKDRVVDFEAIESPPSLSLQTSVETGVSSIPKSDFIYRLEAVIKAKEDGDGYFEAELFIDKISEFKEHIPFHEKTKSMNNDHREFLLDSIRDYLSDFDEI